MRNIQWPNLEYQNNKIVINTNNGLFLDNSLLDKQCVLW
jgi:hypothetical protein